MPMRFLAMLIASLAIMVSPACDIVEDATDDSIPESSVFAPISAVRLAAITVREPLFATMYAALQLGGIHKDNSRLSNSYPSVTYDSLFRLYKLGSSSAKECKELKRRFQNEWDSHPELHPLYSSASEFIGSRCADFASEVFGPEVDLLKEAFTDVWDALRDSWDDVTS